MKVVFTGVPQNSAFKAGEEKDLPGAELDTLQAAGHTYMTATEHKAIQDQVKSREAAVQTAIDMGIKNYTIKPQDEAGIKKLRETALKMEASEPGMGVEFINMRPVDKANERLSGGRVTSADAPRHQIELGRITASEAARGYIESIKPAKATLQSGDWKAVFAQAAEAGARMKALLDAGGQDMRLADVINGSTPGDSPAIARAMDQVIRAADYTDPNSQLGTLNTGIVLMRNLGFLKNILGFMKYITTDLRNEPAMFGQTIWTRYIVPPGVLTWVPGIGFTSDATTINNANNTSTIGNVGTQNVQSGESTQTSGTTTLSVPNTTDRNVLLGQFKAVEISFPISTMAATVRNLFAEQRAAQLYSLANAINQDFLQKTFQGTWNGTVKQFSLGNFGLPTMVSLKNRLTLSMVPDVGRFAIMHSFYHDALLVDTNLLTAKAILALINKDASSFEQGEVPSLFGVKPIETQLASFAVANLNAAQAAPAAVYTPPAIDPVTGNVNFAGINAVGFAGNMSSMIFVARVPQDFTEVQTKLGIPPTSAVEVVTEPDSGLTVMVFKYVNNATMAINVRVCVMWGFGQGHPGIGIVLTP